MSGQGLCKLPSEDAFIVLEPGAGVQCGLREDIALSAAPVPAAAVNGIRRALGMPPLEHDVPAVDFSSMTLVEVKREAKS